MKWNSEEATSKVNYWRERALEEPSEAINWPLGYLSLGNQWMSTWRWRGPRANRKVWFCFRKQNEILAESVCKVKGDSWRTTRVPALTVAQEQRNYLSATYGSDKGWGCPIYRLWHIFAYPHQASGTDAQVSPRWCPGIAVPLDETDITLLW